MKKNWVSILGVLIVASIVYGVMILPGENDRAIRGNPEVSTGPISLEGLWKFQAGDDVQWASPDYDDADWGSKHVPEAWSGDGYPETGQFGWYRLRVELDPKRHGTLDELGIRIGFVRSAYEIYVGGHLVGGVGVLPPDSAINYDRLRVYDIAREAAGREGTVLIALRVWGGSTLAAKTAGGGAYNGTFLLGNYTHLIRSLDAEQVPKLIFAVLFLCAGVYFIYLYRRNLQLDSFLWFGITAIVIACYIVTQSQWKYVLGWPFLVYEKIESVTFYLFLALFSQLVWVVIDKPFNWLLRVYQYFFVIAALVTIVMPGVAIHYYLRGPAQLGVALAILPMLWAVVQQVRAGHSDARTLLYGLLAFCLCGVNDLLINMHVIQSIRVLPLGFLAVMVSMGVSLANSFTAMLNSLEQQVLDRTSELTTVNLQLETANSDLEKLARKDPLTGMLNRRGFADEAAVEVQRFIRSGKSFAVVLSDIDFFKQLNDQYGHACGDHVLQILATQLKTNLRDVDRVARWGGEEFVLLLPETDLAGAQKISEKLRETIEHTSIEFERESLSTTMTFGVAVSFKGESLEHCILRADIALYEGKEAGRNRVSVNEQE